MTEKTEIGDIGKSLDHVVNHDLLDRIAGAVDAHCSLVSILTDTIAAKVREMSALVVQCIRSGGKILIAGNGGSAADAQHLAAEFVGRFIRERRGFPAVALTVDTSILTAIGNDYGFDRIFSRQVEALGRPGDILVAISTSGNSPNIIEAINAARSSGMKVLAFLGRDGGAILTGNSGKSDSTGTGREEAAPDCALVVPSWDTARVQEVHLLAYHCLCGEVEWELERDFASSPTGRGCMSPSGTFFQKPKGETGHPRGKSGGNQGHSLEDAYRALQQGDHSHCQTRGDSNGHRGPFPAVCGQKHHGQGHEAQGSEEAIPAGEPATRESAVGEDHADESVEGLWPAVVDDGLVIEDDDARRDLLEPYVEI